MLLVGTGAPPAWGHIPSTARLWMAQPDVTEGCRNPVTPSRTSPQPRLRPGMFNMIQAPAKTPSQQTPSDATNPADPAVTQLRRRIWVTAVSHGHPESDSTLLAGPDPAAGFPGRDSEPVRRGRREHITSRPPKSRQTDALRARQGVNTHPPPHSLKGVGGPSQLRPQRLYSQERNFAVRVWQGRAPHPAAKS